MNLDLKKLILFYNAYYVNYILIYKKMNDKEEVTNKILQQLDTYHSPSMQHAVDWINEIYGNNEFKKNPHMYVKNWIEKRGFTEEFRIPEDIMLDAFSKFYCK